MGMSQLNGVVAAIGLGILGGAGLLAQPAHAEFIATIAQVGPNVVVTGTGTIDLTGLTLAGIVTANSGIIPDGGVLGVGPPSAGAVDLYTGSISGPASFGTGGVTAPSSSGSGDKVVLVAPSTLDAPEGYVSGTALSDTSTYDNSTLASLGLTPGTYTYTWNRGPAADSFVIQINAASVVPEPANLSLLAAAVMMTLVAARGRRRLPAG
jgi:hypothetical protein